MRDSVGSPFIKLLLIMLVLSFVSFYGFNQVRSGCHSGVIAQVNGEPISINEYMITLKNTYELYKRYGLMKGGNEEQMMKMLKDSVLSQLIEMKLKIQEAKDLGLRVSDRELADSIKKQFSDPKTGEFSQLYYDYTLRQFGMTSEQYEDNQRERLLSMKLDEFIRKTVKISEAEVKQNYKLKNEQVALSYAKIDPSSFKGKIGKVTDKKLKEYFSKNSEDFKLDPQRKIEYVFVKPDNFVSVSEKDLKDYFDETFSKNPAARLNEKRIRASHILLKKEPGQKDTELLKKANEIYEKIENDADFQQLAAKYNTDSTKYTGGDLGYFTKGKMVKPFEEAAFNMKIGDVSKPVKTTFGYHIIKVTDIIEPGKPTFERLKEQVRYEYLKGLKMNPEKSRAATEKINAILSGIKDKLDKNPEMTLKNFKDRENVNWGQTGYISSSSSIEGILDSAQVVRAAFGLLPKETSDIISGFFTKTGYLVRVIDLKEAETPNFEAVKTKVREAYIKNESDRMAMKTAEDLLERSLKDPNLFKSIVQKAGLSVVDTGKFKRNAGGRIPVMGKANDIMTGAFNLTEENPLMDKVMTVEGSYYVIKLEERVPADMEKFSKDKNSFIKISLDERKNEILKDWIAKAKENAKIKRYEIEGGVY